MSLATARISPLFPSDLREWEKPLRGLGWELESESSHSSAPRGLSVVMGDFRHRGEVWHTVALGMKTGNHPEGLVRWGWSQVLGKDPYELADGGVCISNVSPDVPADGKDLYVLFKVRGSVKDHTYHRRPRTVEGFAPGEVLSNGMCVTAPGSSGADGRVYGLYQRFGNRWNPTSLMLAPHHLPTLPKGTANTLRSDRAARTGPAETWSGLESVYLKRLFGRQPDGTIGIVSAVPPPDALDGVAYWRMPSHPTAQIATKRNDGGNTLVGFVERETAERFGTDTINKDPASWVTLPDLHRKVAHVEGIPQQEPAVVAPDAPHWTMCETVSGDMTFMFGQNMFAVEEVTAILGDAKRGMKSWLGAELAAAVATGSPLGWLPNLLGEPRKVLYLTKETPKEQKRRIHDQIGRLCRAAGINPEDFIPNVTLETGVFRSRRDEAKSIKLGDGSVAEVLTPWVVHEDIGLVIMDTLSTFVPGVIGKNVSYWALAEMVQELVDLAVAMNGAVVYMHHSPRRSSAYQLGSQALDAKVAQMLFLSRDKEDIPRVSASVLSRPFVPVEVPIRFQVDPVGTNSGRVRHLNGTAPGTGVNKPDTRHGSMMAVLRDELGTCHDITRATMVEVFQRAIQEGKSLDGAIGGALRTTSGTLTRFVTHAKGEGWIAETGKQGHAHSYKLDMCRHLPALID